MSNSRRLRRSLATSGVTRPQSQPPPDFGAARAVAGAKRGRGTPMVAGGGGGGPSYGSVLQRRLQGVGPYRRTMIEPVRSRKHGSKPGRRGGVNRAHGKAKARGRR